MDTRQPRLRVFAGPNGSGKTSVIEYIRTYKANNRFVDLGYYVNADDIVKELKKKKGFSFSQFDFQAENAEFKQIVSNSGLLNSDFSLEKLVNIYEITGNNIRCLQHTEIERLAQIIADYLRKKLLEMKRRFSFETVFSHPSKLDIMRKAIDEGYKVYLYYVSTESPAINKFREKRERLREDTMCRPTRSTAATSGRWTFCMRPHN
jgi:predicted ABC-type ATPase